eukprot:1172644-Prorocentrum_minimum.AAC.1
MPPDLGGPPATSGHSMLRSCSPRNTRMSPGAVRLFGHRRKTSSKRRSSTSHTLRVRHNSHIGPY